MVGGALSGRVGAVVMASPDVIPEAERAAILSELVCAGVSVVFAECDTQRRARLGRGSRT